MSMEAVEALVEDLITLQELAGQEPDAARRRSLDDVRRHVAERDRGAKVTEAARVLGLSAPTVRTWISAGVLDAVPGTSPVRVGVLSLSRVKQLVDRLRGLREDRFLLADVQRLLRDQAVLASPDTDSGPEDLAAGRLTRLDLAELDERASFPRDLSAVDPAVAVNR